MLRRKKALTFVLINILIFSVSLFILRNYLPIARDFIFPVKVFNNINFLLLGKRGGNSDSPDLTDTMIILSLNPMQKTIKFVSIPRDMWIPEMRAKINTTYYYGKQKNNGLGFAKEIISRNFGVPINYVLVIDFSGFVNVIDALGGIDVEVQNTFIDEKYPIAGKENDLCNGDRSYKCRYETVKFEKGLTFMNGETALKFVRSRNATSDEGTDLARNKRQELVVNAVKNKLLSREMLSKTKINNLYQVLTTSVETDFNISQSGNVARYFFDSRNNVVGINIPDQMLEIKNGLKLYDFQYVFIPKDNDWFIFQKWLHGVGF